jgi:sigma-54 specific flagellar transcriptional regulator A
VPLTLPPLRERRADIPDIAVRYLKRTDPRTHWAFDEDALALLTAPHLEWAGNIRELEAVLERAKNRAAAANEEAEVVEARHLDLAPEAARPKVVTSTRAAASGPQSSGPPAHAVRERWEQLAEQRAELDAVERRIIRDALLKCEGVVAQTARELSVSRTSLISRMATLGIEPHEGSTERAR